MTPLISKNGHQIDSVDAWCELAPPKEGLRQWVDGQSAKELAKCFLERGAPAAASELRDLLATKENLDRNAGALDAFLSALSSGAFPSARPRSACVYSLEVGTGVNGGADLIRACTTLACSVVLAYGVIALSMGVAHAEDCMGRFPEGRFGIPFSHPAVASGKLAVEGFSPLYLMKQSVSVSGPAICDYVYTGDVFRMVETRAAGTLLAGCVGDFDGDGRADVALLMKRQRDGVVIPMVFRSRGAGYEVTQIDGITDPYGYGEDRRIWPGPMCVSKPPSGVFESDVGGKVSVVGDLFIIGWKTYFWNPPAGRFDAILTSD